MDKTQQLDSRVIKLSKATMYTYKAKVVVGPQDQELDLLIDTSTTRTWLSSYYCPKTICKSKRLTEENEHYLTRVSNMTFEFNDLKSHKTNALYVKGMLGDLSLAQTTV